MSSRSGASRVRRARKARPAPPTLKRIARAVDRCRAVSQRLRAAFALALVMAIGIVVGVALTDRSPTSKPVHRVAEASIPLPPAETTQGGASKPEQPAPAPPQDSMLPPAPHPPMVGPGEPTWLRFAVPPPALDGRAMVAVVLDDLGLDRKRTERAVALPGPLTLSFMTYAEELPRQTGLAHGAGHELLLHVPMEPLDAHIDSGPNSLRADLGGDEVLRRLRWGLDRFSGYVGINNHMGSKFTSDAAAMTPVIEELRARGLLFLDSRTAATTVGEMLARRQGVPAVSRSVFLDDETSAPAIGARLADLEQMARRKGAAIAIGHAHDATLAALAAWLPTLAARQLVLVPLTTIVRRNESGTTTTMTRRGSAG
jgi:polysaccharide deacetylase 2 family uncharacterized protein YibQ